MKGSTFSKIIKLTLLLMIVVSIVATYYAMVVKNDYEVITNPDGPDLEE